MVRELLYAVLLLLAAGCSKKEEYYYSTVYTVTEVTYRLTLAEQSDDALAERLESAAAEMVAAAPVQAGGSYRLDFKRYDGGVLTVHPQAGASAVTGTFTKMPAAVSMTFTYGEVNETVSVKGYTDDAGQLCTAFEVDLTDACKEQYGITEEKFELVRIEYTSHLYD